MPQLVPFFFMNEVIFLIVIFIITLYILSKYILPRLVVLFISRNILSKLFK